jgi:glycosyltransferase involved in cell wall biosynthesis
VASPRIVIFGWADSVHLQRWATGVAGRGYEVMVISLGGEPIEGVKCEIIPRSSRLSYLSAARRAVDAARSFKPDLVHAHSAAAFGVWALRSKLRPLIVSVWGSDVVDFPSSWFRKRYLRKVLRNADRLTATSRFLADTTAKLAPGIGSKLDVIPFGVDIPEQVADFPDGPLRLCYIKGHKPIYGIDLLLKAMVSLKERSPGIKLTIAGQGPSTANLKALSSRLDLDDVVTFAGLLDRDDIYRLLGESHIMIMPSLKEAFGVAALEASACARPVIATTVGGLPEVVDNGVTGLLVPPGDVEALVEAVSELGSDRERYRAMGEAGREKVSAQYTWKQSLDAMCNLYESLLNG